MSQDSERIRKRLPDYFKALDLPWHLAAGFMGDFVDDDERPLGAATHHARNLFHVASALREESLALQSEVDKLRSQVAAVVDALNKIAGLPDIFSSEAPGMAQKAISIPMMEMAGSLDNETRAQVWEEAAGVTDNVFQRSLSKYFREQAAFLRTPASRASLIGGSRSETRRQLLGHSPDPRPRI